MKIRQQKKETIYRSEIICGDAFKAIRHGVMTYFVVVSEEPLIIIKISTEKEYPSIGQYMHTPYMLKEADSDTTITPCERQEAMNAYYTVLGRIRQTVEPEQPL